MDMGITASEWARADAWWVNHQGASLAPRGRFAVCAGSKWSSKQWPSERYLEVGRNLIREHGLLPVVLGGNEDRELGHQLISKWGTGLCAAGDLTVRESAALLKNATFYLGNDTGVMHLAASLDWPGRWFPYGAGHQVLRHEVPCAGCLSHHCPHANECLTGITIDSVMQACEVVLESGNLTAR